MAKIDDLALAVGSAAAKYASTYTNLRRDPPPEQRTVLEGRLKREAGKLQAAVSDLLKA